MNTESLWNSFSNPVKLPVLNRDISVDVAIIGGGITGITTANLLKKQGLKVAVLEAREVGKGTTGHSTGNLYLLTDQLLSPIAEKYNLDVLKEVVGARGEAFQQISNNIKENTIDCDYKEQTMFLYEDEETDKIGKEWKIAVDAGIPLMESSSVEFPFENSRVLEIPGQATFNPLRYVQELANKTQGDNCQIYENTRVEEVEEKEEEIVINTTSGSVVAKYVVHATHTPKGVDIQYHTVLGPYREYGVAVKLESNDYPEGIYWSYYNNQKYSIRSYKREGEQFLLCIGSPHKVGQAKDNEEHIRELLRFVKKRFGIKEITHQWGGQNYKPADLLPYIGRKKDSSNQFVATGFSTDGLIYGTLSAMIISEAIAGKKHKYEELFEASRHQPLKSAKKFIKENVNVAKEMVTDWLKKDDEEISNIPTGEGKIIQREGQKSAVYRDREGKVSAHSAVCPHMGCIVHWNNAEETWDCPCHGSRFDTGGDVIEGPALKPLRKLNNS